jgi:opacity protein-like surface antigen
MFQRTILAVIAAMFIPLMATSQVTAPESGGPAPANQGPKYEAYAGFGYTSINQVNQSRYGLIGADLSLTRDWGKYFGLSQMGNYYKPPVESATPGNPGDPSVYEVLVGPEIHAQIYNTVSGFIHGGFGYAHTGGEAMNPNSSFAGGFGGGLSYGLSPRWAIRASGDKIGAAYSLIDALPGYSSHRTWNSSATIGIVYKF